MLMDPTRKQPILILRVNKGGIDVSTVMNASEFVKKLKDVANNYKT